MTSPRTAGVEFERFPKSAAAAAFGDVDNDGDTDVVIVNNSGPARLLLNTIGNRNHWIGLRLTEQDGQRHALGARVEVLLGNGTSIVRSARAAASYASSNDPRVLIGLGEHASVREIRVRWPDGSVETWREIVVDRYSRLRRSQGESIDG